MGQGEQALGQTGSSESHVRAVLRLHLAAHVGAITFAKLIRAFGSAEQAIEAGRTGWQRVDGVGTKTVDAIAAVTDEDVRQEIEEARKLGVTILTQEDPRYPVALKTIYDPPAVLYVRGEILPADAVALGVVGSRRCTHYGLEQATRFGELLGRAGLTIVSGGARGIDTAAHRGALAAGGRTIAVMGCGLCHCFPPENRELFETIANAGRGALVSELPMRTAVLSGNFPTRNRIISGLSLGVLVVEAARRSGSLLTAADAAKQGREVFAVPGRVDSPFSQGTNELIRGGSILVQNLEDILEHLGVVGDKLEQAAQSVPLPATPVAMDATEKKLFDALGQGALSLDELARTCGVESGRAASAMTMLVLKGAVKQQAGNIFARKGKAGLFG
jgi:DNA processing protein